MSSLLDVLTKFIGMGSKDNVWEWEIMFSVHLVACDCIQGTIHAVRISLCMLELELELLGNNAPWIGLCCQDDVPEMIWQPRFKICSDQQ